MQNAPNAPERHIRKKWKELYFDDYLPWCKFNDLPPVKRNVFTSIRKRARPRYKKSQKLRRRGFDLTTCTRCEMYESLIKKAKDPEIRSTLNNGFEYHRRLAQGARDHYARHRAKATLPIYSDCDMDMAIDASGGAGTCHFPHYAATAKDEPSRHKLLDIKCTFTKIHGFGTKVYISFPNLETQGGNLTVEVGKFFLFIHTKNNFYC